MSIFNHPDFLTIRQLDLENKLLAPTAKLYAQVSFKLDLLYQDIRTVLIDAHSFASATAKQVYDHPVETITAWYSYAVNSGNQLYAQVQNDVLPKAEALYQHWQIQAVAGVEKAGQSWQAFWDNPAQVTIATFEPVTRYAATATEQSGQYLQMFLDNPEQFIAGMLAPVTGYLNSLTESAEGVLINGYYTLSDLFSLLIAQPSATLHALYNSTLSTLLDIYYELISSVLVMA